MLSAETDVLMIALGKHFGIAFLPTAEAKANTEAKGTNIAAQTRRRRSMEIGLAIHAGPLRQRTS